MNVLQLRYDVTEQMATLRPYIDGQDLLASYKNDQGLDPDRLLPPLSSVLFPTKLGRSTLIGVCSCGETGCGSLTVHIRRVGSEVAWEPVDRPQYETLSRSYRFDLTQYLEAVDWAAGDAPAEGRGRRVARMVRLMLGMYDQAYDSLTYFHTTRIDWISAWPWTSDVVKVSTSTADGQVIREFNAGPTETDREFAARIAAELNDLRLGRSGK
jgi:hypothetical protein